MKRKYYLTDREGKMKIFSSFNSLLRNLKLSEEEELRVAEEIGKVAFTGTDEKHYENQELGIRVEYR